MNEASSGMIRIGIGVDAHAFTPDRALILGGVSLPFSAGLLGHSDADVLSHAVIDALLGAASLGDIGNHFPDNDPVFRNISSLLLLKSTSEILQKNHFTINNIDATIIAQEPKLTPFIDEMKRNISHALRIKNEIINIKATTTEYMGFTGRKEGIAAIAIASLLC